jgi:hypothetical protein
MSVPLYSSTGRGTHGIGQSKYLIKKVNQSHYRPEVPRGFQEVKVPRLRDNGSERWLIIL